MAAKIRESYETLEAKVEARTEALQASEQTRARRGSLRSMHLPICGKPKIGWSKPRNSPRSAS